MQRQETMGEGAARNVIRGDVVLVCQQKTSIDEQDFQDHQENLPFAISEDLRGLAQ